MGGGNHSEQFHAARSAELKTSRGTTFTHTQDIQEGKAQAGCHARLNPMGVARRECRDGPDHPSATPIIIAFDVTGSMNTLPPMFQEKLGALLAMLIKNSVVPDPQILFMGVGDAAGDRAPIQIGQFESDNRMDEDLSVIYLEGGGRGNNVESYELAMYFAAYRVVADNYEKRQQKGYMFIIGDEGLRPIVSKEHVAGLMGNPPEADMPIADVVRDLMEKWHVFVLRPDGSAHFNNAEIHNTWTKHFGEGVHKISDPQNICEIVATIVGTASGRFASEDEAKAAIEEAKNNNPALAAAGAAAPAADSGSNRL